MAYIRALQMHQFRGYDAASLDDVGAGPVVFWGPNGAGKTNILEAVSLLTPGRGLRGAKVSEIQRAGSIRVTEPWAVSAGIEGKFGSARLGTGAHPDLERRLIRINGADHKAQGDLGEYLSCVWLTPQMDRLFLDAASSRRRFLDRLVFAFDSGHAGRVTRYENAMSQRSKILKESQYPDPAWLDALEATMSETGVAIAAARLDLVQRLQASCDTAGKDVEFFFPRARLRAAGTAEELLSHCPAVEVEEMMKYQLSQSRLQDQQTGGAASGPHKSDLTVHYAERDMPADQCSTGEQKALLIGVVLSHARLIAAARGEPPLLLLDEIAAHLDDGRRQGLYGLLLELKAQVWMTGTDRSLFKGIEAQADMFHVANAKAIREADRPDEAQSIVA